VCSLDLDEHRQEAEPHASRWDYILGTDDGAFGMEVHPAKASEVDTVIRKKRWAETLLARRCRLQISAWYWVVPQGSRLQFTQQSPHARRLAQERILFPARQMR
jgi:hypothetical protein